MIVETKVKTWGNGYGVRISKKLAREMHVAPGDTVHIQTPKKRRTFQGFGMFKGFAPFERDRDDRF